MTRATCKRTRLVSEAPLTSKDFDTAARRLGQSVHTYRKVAPIAARLALSGEVIETRWNGEETRNTAQKGDWVATNLAQDRTPLQDTDGNFNTYIIGAQIFDQLYEPAPNVRSSEMAQGRIFRRRETVEAFYVPAGFDIAAPWGERQVAARGYLIRSGEDVYGNHAETFKATYKQVRRRKA